MGTTVADQGNDIHVRQLGPDDRDAYFTLRLQGLKAHPEAFAMSYDEALQRGPSLHDAMLQGTHTDEGDFLLGAFAGAGGPLVGVVGLFRAQRIKERHKASVGGMYVSPEASGRGVGRALLAELFVRAQRLEGLQQIQLVVASTNEAARRLYESFGFRTYGREIGAMCIDGVLYDADYMARHL
jgi:ribosomal protein S18 acetylase RimI-like enzyme